MRKFFTFFSYTDKTIGFAESNNIKGHLDKLPLLVVQIIICIVFISFVSIFYYIDYSVYQIHEKVVKRAFSLNY